MVWVKTFIKPLAEKPKDSAGIEITSITDAAVFY
jgi:hypothetical protein